MVVSPPDIHSITEFVSWSDTLVNGALISGYLLAAAVISYTFLLQSTRSEKAAGVGASAFTLLNSLGTLVIFGSSFSVFATVVSALALIYFGFMAR